MLPHSLQRKHTGLLTSSIRTSALQNCKDKSLLFTPTSFWYLVRAAPANPYRKLPAFPPLQTPTRSATSPDPQPQISLVHSEVLGQAELLKARNTYSGQPELPVGTRLTEWPVPKSVQFTSHKRERGRGMGRQYRFRLLCKSRAFL